MEKTLQLYRIFRTTEYESNPYGWKDYPVELSTESIDRLHLACQKVSRAMCERREIMAVQGKVKADVDSNGLILAEISTQIKDCLFFENVWLNRLIEGIAKEADFCHPFYEIMKVSPLGHTYTNTPKDSLPKLGWRFWQSGWNPCIQIA